MLVCFVVLLVRHLANADTYPLFYPPFTGRTHFCILPYPTGKRMLPSICNFEASEGRWQRSDDSVMAFDAFEQKSNQPVLGLNVVLKEEAAASVIEVSGVIKWFDVAKGYGFMVPDNGMPDVLLHMSCLRRDGYQTAYEGARVVCAVLPGPKGLQAFRIISMDKSTAIHPGRFRRSELMSR